MSEGEDFVKLSVIENCPICGCKLEKGYLAAPRGLYWATEKKGLGTSVVDILCPGIRS